MSVCFKICIAFTNILGFFGGHTWSGTSPAATTTLMKKTLTSLQFRQFDQIYFSLREQPQPNKEVMIKRCRWKSNLRVDWKWRCSAITETVLSHDGLLRSRSFGSSRNPSFPRLRDEPNNVCVWGYRFYPVIVLIDQNAWHKSCRRWVDIHRLTWCLV